jgi:hypothetical protein
MKAWYAVLLVLAVALGLFFAYVEHRPNFDDAGVLVMALTLASAILGFLGPQRPWLWALAVGAWMPAINIVTGRGFASMVALLLAFAGAYAGSFLRSHFPSMA